MYPKQTMARHQAAILNFYGFRAFKPHGGAVLSAEIARLVQSHLKPKLIFSRALEVLVREKVEVPGYFPLAALILTAINQHNRRLTGRVEELLTPDTRALLHDNLVDVLLTSLQSFHNSALREHKDQCYVRREQRNESLKVLVGFLDHGVLETLARRSAPSPKIASSPMPKKCNAFARCSPTIKSRNRWTPSSSPN
jgi:hypothetical protein